MEPATESLSNLKQWAKDAEASVKEVSSAPYGQKDKILSKKVEGKKLSIQMLRRAISAYEFAQIMFDRHGIDLTRATLTAVEEVRRWASHDEAAAIDKARGLVAGGVTVRAFRRDELAARGKKKLRNPPPQRILRGRLKELTLKKLRKRFGAKGVSLADNLGYLPEIDFVAAQSSVTKILQAIENRPEDRDILSIAGDVTFYPLPATAVLIHARMANETANHKAMMETYLKGVGLLSLFESVLILLSHIDDRDALKAWANNFSLEREGLVAEFEGAYS